MAINKDTVKYVAALSRIELSESEVEHFTEQLNSILEYVKQLERLPTDNLEPTSHVLKMKNVFRTDTVKSSLEAADVLKNTLHKENNLFKVKKIIEI